MKLQDAIDRAVMVANELGRNKGSGRDHLQLARWLIELQSLRRQSRREGRLVAEDPVPKAERFRAENIA